MSKFFIRMAALIVAAGLVLAACGNILGGDENDSGSNNSDNSGKGGTGSYDDDDSGKGTGGTGGNSNTDNRGFLDILYGEAGGNSGDSTGEGVYVGIISFAGDANVITEPVLLNASGYATLKNKIASDYTRATTGGTSLFVAVHRALANLKAKEDTYPAKLDTVSIITFTDGLDNRSLAVLANPTNSSGPNYQIEGKTYDISSSKSAGEYTDYIKDEIDSRRIANKTIKAYAVGVQGSDVTDTASFESSLPKIASNGTDESGVSYFTKLTDFAGLKETFQKIAGGLNVTHTSTNIVMTTTQSDAGTKYRWTFDGQSVPENSAKYIEATIAIDGNSGAYSLTNITYEGGITTTQGSGPLAGTTNSDGHVDFTFTDVTGYDADKDQKPMQWIKRPDAAVFGPESEIKSTGNAEKNVEHKTAIIYLVLDASTSLTEANITSIKSAISSGSGGNTGNSGNTGGNTGNTGNSTELEEVFNDTPANWGATQPLMADTLLALADEGGISSLSDLTAAGGELYVNGTKITSGYKMIQPYDTVRILMPKGSGK
jgi:hypothetical protein